MSQLVELNPARRFGGLDRLYGDGCREYLLYHASAMVVGLGGVGSWAVEALARSGVGRITLVDFDHVAESNINRQIQASDCTLGLEKTQALAQRIGEYAPDCKLTLIDAFLEPSNAQALFDDLASQANASPVVLDCCDQVQAKVAMAVQGRAKKIPVLVAGSAGGKRQPWLVQPADLRDCINDPLLAKLRYQLRKHHGFSRDKRMKVPVFYSQEAVTRNASCAPEAGLNCAGYGSVVSVTATMGMQMAAWALGHWDKARLKLGPSE
ncbi:ThiF family adenylyltransferase [Limnobacter sp.]|uniref:tRNA threonylcarbamoyladenosine dehydratase n=1 Tax=Limnobacter sp. TaxID=2003368 RepID=UPI0035198BC4